MHHAVVRQLLATTEDNVSSTVVTVMQMQGAGGPPAFGLHSDAHSCW